jgi:hypothetical protein
MTFSGGLNSLASLGKDEMGEACSKNGEEMNAYMLLMGKQEATRETKTGGWIILEWILER